MLVPYLMCDKGEQKFCVIGNLCLLLLRYVVTLLKPFPFSVNFFVIIGFIVLFTANSYFIANTKDCYCFQVRILVTYIIYVISFSADCKTKEP